MKVGTRVRLVADNLVFGGERLEPGTLGTVVPGHKARGVCVRFDGADTIYFNFADHFEPVWGTREIAGALADRIFAPNLSGERYMKALRGIAYLDSNFMEGEVEPLIALLQEIQRGESESEIARAVKDNSDLASLVLRLRALAEAAPDA